MTKATFKVIAKGNVKSNNIASEEIQLHDFQLDEAQYQFLLRFLQQLDPIWRIPALDFCNNLIQSGVFRPRTRN
jgi:hypothetical protein